MSLMETELRTINRKFKTVKVVVRPVDPLAKGEKPFGQIQVFMIPVKSSSLFSSIKNDTTSYSFSQIKSMISCEFLNVNPISQSVKTLSGNFGYFEVDKDNDYLICVVAENYLQKQFQFTYPEWDPVTITIPDNKEILDPEINIHNVENKNVVSKDEIDKQLPFITIRLLPSTTYIFESAMTLVRVLVTKSKGLDEEKTYQPIFDALLFFSKIDDQKKENLIYVGRTDKCGQATLCCNRMGQDRIVQINGFTIDGYVGTSEQKEFILIVFDNKSKLTKKEAITFKEFRMNTKEIILNE
jgi:hypothetical protein